MMLCLCVCCIAWFKFSKLLIVYKRGQLINRRELSGQKGLEVLRRLARVAGGMITLAESKIVVGVAAAASAHLMEFAAEKG